MHICKSLNNISENVHCFFAAESAHAIHMIEEGASIQILKDQIDIFPLLEKAVEFNNFRMVERLMEFNLFNKLVNKIELFKLAFSYFFYGY